MGASERQAVSAKSPWWGEHVHRYELALEYLSPSDKVLDIACGTGFGSKMLADFLTTGEVIGADVSEETLAENNIRYQSTKNLHFQFADATNLRYEDNTFDAILSFETLEHVEEDDKMVTELRRVLKPRGTLILSTPNIIINSPTGVVTNPYHIREYNYKELVTVLNNTFPDIHIYGQHYSRYDKRQGISVQLAKAVEKLLYQRGVRKLPIRIQDAIMKAIGRTPMYPRPEDYILVDDLHTIQKCKTFIAIWAPDKS